jgi:TPP-dependent pyruvate/acetoin dehydrogenase alpha subunit
MRMTDNNKFKAYKVMLLSRILDEFCEDLVDKGVRVSHFHSGIGQEALSVGGVIDLRKDDYLYYTHRGISPLLAKGITLKQAMLDLFIKDGGTNRGCGSVMHTCAPEIGIVGRNGVFGYRFTFAAGLALAAKTRKTDSVAVCYYGEAAGARGPYYEALNMAVLWKLPVIFIAETNGFSVNSRTVDMFAPGNMSDMWRGFDIPVVQFDGNDLNAVRNATQEAIKRARAGHGPSVLEGLTYRISQHIPGDDHLAYRTQEEIDEWKKKDPVERTRNELIKEGYLTEKQDEELRKEFQKEVQETYDFVKNAPIIPEDEAYKPMYYADLKA